MSQPSYHGQFTITRDLAKPVGRVWGAFSNLELKKRWFGAASDLYDVVEHAFDFREGGSERQVGHWHSGRITEFRSHYYDIVAGERITYAYEMIVDAWKMSVSLATIEIAAHGGGTRLTITEQGVFYGEQGEANAVGRQRGTEGIVEMLVASLDDARA